MMTVEGIAHTKLVDQGKSSYKESQGDKEKVVCKAEHNTHQFTNTAQPRAQLHVHGVHSKEHHDESIVSCSRTHAHVSPLPRYVSSLLRDE